MIECDVLVVGAGAAGAVCSLKLALEEFKVLIIEKEARFGGHTKPKIDVTEDKGVDEIMKELNLPILMKTNKSKWFSRNHSFDLESEVSDLYFKRGPSEDSLESHTLGSCLDAGAQILFNAQPVKFKFKEKNIEEVRVKVKGKSRVIKPKIIVGADGFNSTIFKLGKFSIEKEIASFSAYGTLGKGFDMPPGITYILFDNEYAQGGYMYMGKTNEDEGVACIVVEEHLISKRSKVYFQKFIEKNENIKMILAKSKLGNEFGGRGIASVMKTRVKNNILLIGEAGRVLDPVFGYGMRNTLVSSYTGAEVISKALDKHNLGLLREYDIKLKPMVTKIEESAKRRDSLRQISNQEYDEIIQTDKIMEYIQDVH